MPSKNNFQNAVLSPVTAKCRHSEKMKISFSVMKYSKISHYLDLDWLSTAVNWSRKTNFTNQHFVFIIIILLDLGHSGPMGHFGSL
jgi:hypothetical protein